MALDGKIGSLSTKVIQVAAAGHPAVILTGLIKQNQGLWEPGTILTRDNGELAPWDGTGGPAGVLADHCDSTGQVSANYLAHGCVAVENLKMAGGTAPTGENIFTLHQIGVYAI